MRYIATLVLLTVSVLSVKQIVKVNSLFGTPNTYFSDNGIVPPEPGISVSDDSENDIIEAVEQQPSFPGGQGALTSWLGKNLRYPELAQQNNIEGKVIVQFVVEKDGSISQVVVARGVDKDLDREAVRVVKKMPRWQPGKNNGIAVRSKFTLPVTFRLQH